MVLTVTCINLLVVNFDSLWTMKLALHTTFRTSVLNKFTVFVKLQQLVFAGHVYIVISICGNTSRVCQVPGH